MRRRCPRPGIGALLCAAGIIVILAMILPTSFWWFALGIALTTGGMILIIRR